MSAESGRLERGRIAELEAEMQKQHPYAFGAGELGGAAGSVLALPAGELLAQIVVQGVLSGVVALKNLERPAATEATCVPWP